MENLFAPLFPATTNKHERSIPGVCAQLKLAMRSDVGVLNNVLSAL